MAFRRFGNSRGRSFSFRSRFRRPLARRKLLWTNALFTIADIEAGASRGTLLSSAQWVLNATTGNLERAKLEKVMLINMALSLSGSSTNLYPSQLTWALYVDDADASSPGDPTTTTFFDAVQPFAMGQFDVPSNANTATITAPVFPGRYIGHRDNLRVYRAKRSLRTDHSLFMSVSTGAGLGYTTVDISGLARCLVSLD